jgi:hypothetical protein
MNWHTIFSTKKADDDQPQTLPVVKDLELSRHYSFQYENFVISTQHDLYLLLEKNEGVIHGLKFNFGIFKYGSPNDEARGGHALTKYGLGWYGFYQIENSPWIKELMIANRIHDRHNDSMFDRDRHYAVCFKDVMLEVVCTEYEEFSIQETDVFSIVQKELSCLE